MRLICGIGINDVNYNVNPTINGKQKMCPFYRAWANMLMRNYSAKYQERQPTYKGCSVIEEWLTFSNFRAWMISQDWEGKHLDKDLIIAGNKVYSPKTCVFICGELNKLLGDRGRARGYLPLGVTASGKRYQAQVSKKGKHIHLGRFKTPEEAHQAWRKAKAQIILNSRELTNDIRVKNSLAKRAKELLL